MGTLAIGGRMPRRNGSLGREITAVRNSLRELDRSLVRLAGRVSDAARDLGQVPALKVGRRLELTPSRTRALRVHGKYMGFLRHLKPRQKAEVKALRAKKGVKAAIARARKLGAGR